MVESRNILMLMIGNSRYHWAKFEGNKLQKTWHTTYTEIPESLTQELAHTKAFYIASVVPSQSQWIQEKFPHAQELKLKDIPLQNLYPTLGIDRALALWGAATKYGFPCLVIDGGTALTFSGVDGDRRFVGGAILPGLRLQFQSLSQGTAALPNLDLPPQLPSRWAMNTEAAIASGITQTICAGVASFVTDWLRQYPQSIIIFTGGDGQWLQKKFSAEISANNGTKYRQNIYDADLIFAGMTAII